MTTAIVYADALGWRAQAALANIVAWRQARKQQLLAAYEADMSRWVARRWWQFFQMRPVDPRVSPGTFAASEFRRVEMRQRHLEQECRAIGASAYISGCRFQIETALLQELLEWVNRAPRQPGDEPC